MKQRPSRHTIGKTFTRITTKLLLQVYILWIMILFKVLEILRPNKKFVAGILIISVLFFVVTPMSTYVYFAQELGSKESIMDRNDTGVILYDRNDRPFFTLYQAKHKTFVPLSQIPKATQEAAVASEDKDFYSHHGYSIKAIIRSLYRDFQEGKLAYGGSTITQQLVKNVLLNSNKSITRKFQEIILAQELERRYSKDEILEMYLNSVYFGEGAFGIEEASQAYFGKHSQDLTLGESALLIGLLPAPSQLSPLHGDINQAKARQKMVLQKMVEQKYISLEDKKNAEEQALVFSPVQDDLNSHAFHFAMMVRDELIAKYGEEQIARSGFKVKTTLDLDWQEYAENAVKQQVAKLAPNGVSNGAAVVIDPKTGEIKALVGSKDWFNADFGKVNVAIRPRQPGSAFKPIVYSTAFEKGVITPSTVLKDVPTTFGTNYRPKDYDGRYRGQVTARRALANSLNIPSVEVLSRVGVPEAVDMAQRLGITTIQDPQKYGLSLVLGAGEVKLVELTDAYAVFADQGQYNPPTTILEIEDKRQQIVYKYNPAPKQVLTPEVSFLISSILSDNKTRAEEFGNTLNISRQAAVKTGTTENYRDAWTIGYTPSLVVGVWVGNNNGASMDNIAGSLGAAPIWQGLMEKFLAGTPVEKFTPPEGVVAVTTCRPAGAITAVSQEATSSAFTEYYIKGTQPQQSCSIPRPIISISPIPTPTFQAQPTTITIPSPSPSPTLKPSLGPTLFPHNQEPLNQVQINGQNGKDQNIVVNGQNAIIHAQ
ncbi:MAG: penicillin-binding protein 1C [Patescibacteria group bacterium]|nr:penicillin-binding protein 1C [Patescibacteria group bacterium]